MNDRSSEAMAHEDDIDKLLRLVIVYNGSDNLLMVTLGPYHSAMTGIFRSVDGMPRFPHFGCGFIPEGDICPGTVDQDEG